MKTLSPRRFDARLVNNRVHSVYAAGSLPVFQGWERFFRPSDRLYREGRSSGIGGSGRPAGGGEACCSSEWQNTVCKMDDDRRGGLYQLSGLKVDNDSDPSCCDTSVVAIPFTVEKLQEHAGGQIRAASVSPGDTGASGQDVSLPGTAVSVVRTQDLGPESAIIANPNAVRRVASLERPGTRGTSAMQRLTRKIWGGSSLEKNEAIFFQKSVHSAFTQ